VPSGARWRDGILKEHTETTRGYQVTKAGEGKRTVLYARFSSDLQNERSIDDQFAVCEAVAKRDGLTIIRTYLDRAKSGASMFERDGLLEMMTAAKARQFDCIVVESLDRLSRDQEDLAGIFKRLTFYGIRIQTVNEGATTSLHIGIRGIVGSMFLTDLGNKVRRGLSGRVREGKFPGTVTYGYRKIPGRPGEREVNPAEADVVRRIFEQYAQGRSPRAIAVDLTREGVPTPGGAAGWSHQMFVSGGLRQGMLGNRLYIGVLEWNRNRTILNPETGSRTKRAAPADERLSVAVPHLRIIDQALWDAANATRQQRAKYKFGEDRKSNDSRVGVVVRNDYLLGGLLRCGTCGGPMRIMCSSTKGKYPGSRVACAAATQTATCEHKRSYELTKLTDSVLDGMRVRLTDRAAIARLTREYHEERSLLERRHRVDTASITKALNRIHVKIDRTVAAIRDSDIPVQQLVDQLKPLELERIGLAERLRLVEQSNVVNLHPKIVDAFVANVETLWTALTKEGEMQPGAREAFRNIIDTVVVHPTAKKRPYETTAYARLGAIAGIDLFPPVRTPAEILDSEGVSFFAPGNPGTPGLPVEKNGTGLIPLGRWVQRAKVA
jgi:site-specific DNA recombinase